MPVLSRMTVPLLMMPVPEPWKQPPSPSEAVFSVQTTSLKTIKPLGSQPNTWTTEQSQGIDSEF